MITFYRIPSDSPNVRKISIMLAETGLPHRTEIVERNANGELSAHFFTVNPNATVPALTDSELGVTLFESGAILYYLAEKSNQLLPKSLKDRAEAMKWVTFEAANVGPTMGELYYYLLKYSGDLPNDIVRRYQEKLAHHCAILDNQLAAQEYLCGEFSIADIALYPWTVALEDMAEIQISNYPHLAKWADTIGKRPSVKTG